MSRRDEQREWEGDAVYEAWRRGAPEPGYDEMDDAFWRGDTPGSFVGGMLRQQHDRAQRRHEEEQYEEHCQEEQARECEYWQGLEFEMWRLSEWWMEVTA